MFNVLYDVYSLLKKMMKIDVEKIKCLRNSMYFRVFMLNDYDDLLTFVFCSIIAVIVINTMCYYVI